MSDREFYGPERVIENDLFFLDVPQLLRLLQLLFKVDPVPNEFTISSF